MNCSYWTVQLLLQNRGQSLLTVDDHRQDDTQLAVWGCSNLKEALICSFYYLSLLLLDILPSLKGGDSY